MDASPSILQIEAACLSAWPSIKSALDGSWLWRFAKGYSKRANSVQCLDPADDGDAARRLAGMAALSARHAIAPVFRVTPLAGPGVLDALDQAGWTAFEESRVLAMRLDGRSFDVDADIRFFEPTDPAWLDVQAAMSGYSPATVETLRTLLGLIAPESRGLLAYDAEGNPAAAALAVNAGGIGVYLNVVTRPENRRAGHGRAVMRAALDWTRAAGATSAAIQVISDNAPAVSLYQSLGFDEIYRYHYRRPS
ncbi:GNAT family N-acetyltransferase [Kaistia dalseonensis]|uniref:GNAT superfamily N-acetyltransferase n=1 Tax=Kaistia dalseonensis TaxID=410840 RepID=A0ABU0H3L0_9HYPH|nr:GNAT family N-acetyltransferase [Kaistia dalseonensis]MCX5494296.1 GNAT family N-acetyltransferase [Kaistia dalseonensis]MDQ0436877.1 GNAT superfamily N-acetyltransferase [Kaistia dalseonensis]